MLTTIDRAVTVGGMAVCLLAASLSARASAEGTLPLPSDSTVRVLISSGQGDHDWRASTPFLRRLLADTGRFDVRVCEAPAGLTDRMLADFDVLVADHGAPALRSDAEKAISRFVESGKGLVVTHGALGSYTSMHTREGDNQSSRPELAKMVPEHWPASLSSGSHTPAHFWEVRIARPEHPIVRGMASGFMTADTLYRGLAIRPGTEVIALANGDAKTGRSGNEQPILLALGYGKGRVFCSALGHDLAAMQEKEFITSFVRGTEWAATGTVTLPADLGLPRPTLDAVKGLVITGGHDHETSFYTLFDGYKDLAGMPVASSTTAFQNDLRGKYDVLIMYDFSRDLDQIGKKNLRDFVEGGKGVVVLHHALLDYQEWPWWYEDVVGGRYRLKSEGNIPSSTVKNGQQIFVTPALDHAITAGIGPFHIVDETYKRMWFSPRVRPLLTTDNPNSDSRLAWIGPCATSRVVAIQLGHGPSAFGHPSYRALVHNAILWSAGRIK
jgi:type 1 glutamine amidotransferase